MRWPKDLLIKSGADVVIILFFVTPALNLKEKKKSYSWYNSKNALSFCMFWCRCTSRKIRKDSCPLRVLSSSHNNPSPLVLYNRAALFPCSTVALTLGQHPKIGNRPVCSGRVSLFQRNSLLKVRPKTAVCFQWSCSSTSAPQPSFAWLYTVYHVYTCEGSRVCAEASVCVGQQVIVEARLYSVSLITDGRLWSLRGLSLSLASFLKPFIKTSPHHPAWCPSSPRSHTEKTHSSACFTCHCGLHM